MGATEQVSVSGGCFRKERRTLLQKYNMRSLYPMTTLSMEHLEPLSFESRMEVQESNILYSSRSVPSVQSWCLPPHSRLEKNSPSSSIQEPPLSQDSCVLTEEALSSLSSSTYQTRVFGSFYDTSSRHSGIRKSGRADADGFMTCFKARIHDEFNDNYALGHGLRKEYFDFKDHRNGFATSVGKLVAQYDKTHDQQDVFEFTKSVRTDSEGNPDQLVNSSGRNPVGIPHGDEKLNKSAKSQGKANDDLEDDVNQAATELENEEEELSDDTQTLLDANKASQKHHDSLNKSKSKKKGKKTGNSTESSKPKVKNAQACSLFKIFKEEYRELWENYGSEGAKLIIDKYHSSSFLPEEAIASCSEDGSPMILVTCFNSQKYILNFRLFLNEFLAVTSVIPIMYCPECKELKLGYIDGMDYPAAGNSMLSIALVNDILEGVFTKRRSINSYVPDIQRDFCLGGDYLNRTFRYHQLFTTHIGHFLIKSVLSFLAKASTDETPISVLSIQGRSKVSDEIRSNMSEDDVSHITDTSQPYAAVWKSKDPDIPAVACNLSFGRGVFSLEAAGQMYWTDVEAVLNGGKLIYLKEMISDGYPVYVYETSMYGIELFMCHVHGRSEFFKAGNPKALNRFIKKFDKNHRIKKIKSYLKGNNSNIACSIILSLYSAFFAMEQKVQALLEESRNLSNGKNVTDEDLVKAEACRKEAAALRSGPMRELMNFIYDVIDTMRELYTFKNGKWVSISKGNDYAAACVYMLNNKEYFYNCLDNVDMVVHNNDTEQVMSRIALQRKNGYLTVSVKGAELDCGSRSVIETLKANGLDITQGLSKLSHASYKQLYTLVMHDEARQGKIGLNKEVDNTYSTGNLIMPDENRLLEMLPGIDFVKLIPVLFNETAQAAIKNLGNSDGSGEDIYQKINDRAHELLMDWLSRYYEQEFRKTYASIDGHESELNDLADEFNRVADEYENHAQSSAAASGGQPDSYADPDHGTSPGPDIDHGEKPGPQSGQDQDNQTQSLSEAEEEEINQTARSNQIIDIVKRARNANKRARIKSSELERALTGELETDAEAENAKADEFAKECGLLADDEHDRATGNRPLSVKSFLSFINNKIGHVIDKCTLMQHNLEGDTSSGDYDLKLVKEIIEPGVLKKFTSELNLLSNTDKSLRSRGMAGSNISYGINFLIDHVSVAWHNAQMATGENREELRKIAVNCINWLSSFLKDCREHMNIVFFQIAEDARSRSNAMEDMVKRIEDRIIALRISLPPRP